MFLLFFRKFYVSVFRLHLIDIKIEIEIDLNTQILLLNSLVFLVIIHYFVFSIYCVGHSMFGYFPPETTFFSNCFVHILSFSVFFYLFRINLHNKKKLFSRSHFNGLRRYDVKLTAVFYQFDFFSSPDPYQIHCIPANKQQKKYVFYYFDHKYISVFLCGNFFFLKSNSRLCHTARTFTRGLYLKYLWCIKMCSVFFKVKKIKGSSFNVPP